MESELEKKSNTEEKKKEYAKKCGH